jgi:hypothetical protein
MIVNPLPEFSSRSGKEGKGEASILVNWEGIYLPARTKIDPKAFIFVVGVKQLQHGKRSVVGTKKDQRYPVSPAALGGILIIDIYRIACFSTYSGRGIEPMFVDCNLCPENHAVISWVKGLA